MKSLHLLLDRHSSNYNNIITYVYVCTPWIICSYCVGEVESKNEPGEM